MPQAGIVDGVTKFRSDHLDHEGPDLARGAELPVQRGLSQVSEEILEDIALHVRAELPEVDRVELVDHLLQHIGIGDLQHRIAEVLGDLRLVLHERRHVSEDFVTDEIAQVVAAPEAPLGPPEPFGLLGEQACTLPPAPRRPLELPRRLLLVEELEVDEVRDLLDVGDRVGHPTGPQDVGDPVELAAQDFDPSFLVSSRC